MTLTVEQLKKILGPSNINDAKLLSITNAFNETCTKYLINTNKRKCHFLAQVLHETSGFKFTSEIWCNSRSQQKYDTRADLGNTPAKDGDGFKFKGRGWIQLTGRNNYNLLSKEFGKDFIITPELIAKEPYNALSAGWFWSQRNLNANADADDIITLTRKVNGGINGLDDRKNWLLKSKSVLNY